MAPGSAGAGSAPREEAMSEAGKASESWVFEKQQRRNDGWNQPGEHHFAGNPLSHLAREMIQNSLDARAGEQAVRVKFQARILSAKWMPGLDSLRAALMRCLRRSEETGGDKAEAQQQMRDALEALGRSKIRVLSVSDSGTQGMSGPAQMSELKDDETSPYGKYLNSEGISGGKDRSGSHGIGKHAALLVSLPRCIIVSTAWNDAARGRRTLIQGHAVLRTHFDEKRVKYGGHGYWGKPWGDPLTEEECPEKHKWLKRKEQGTTINIVGFHPRIRHMWDRHVLAHVAINFFSALERGKLEVEIHPTEETRGYLLDKESVASVLSGDLARTAMEESGDEVGYDSKKEERRLHSARLYHECLSQEGSEEVFFRNVEVENLGQCRIGIKVFEKGSDKGNVAPRRFLLLRNNIWIKEMDNNFNSSYKPFAGVVECLDPDGNELLRSMEPVAHDDLVFAHLAVEQKRRCKAAMRSLKDRLTEVANKHAGPEFESEGEWRFLDKIFPCEGEGEGRDGDLEFDSEHEFRMGRLEEIREGSPAAVRVKVERRAQEKGKKGREGGSSRRGRRGGGNRGGQGRGEGPGTGGKGKRGAGAKRGGESLQDMSLDNVRFVQTDSKSVEVCMTPAQSGDALLSLYEVASDGKRRKVPIGKSPEGETRPGGNLKVHLEEGKRNSVILNLRQNLSQEFAGGLALSAAAESEKRGGKPSAES